MTEKKIDIEKVLCETVGVLQTKDQEATAIIMDAELDELSLKFNYDRCVEIDTSGLSYVTLSLKNLKDLRRLILEAEKWYDENLTDEP